MNASRILSFLLVATCLTSGQQGETSRVVDGVDRRSMIDKYVDEHKGTAGCPGVSVAAFENGELVFTKSYGVARANGAQVNNETIFSVASITKPVVAMAVLKIEASGLLKIDDRVAIHIPGFADAVPQLAEKLTIRHLLTHNSGITTKSGRLGQRESLLIEFQNENPSVFPQGIIKKMEMRPPGDNGGDENYWYGLGWGVLSKDSGNSFYHSGFNIGYEGLVFLDPNKDSGIVVFANAGSGFASNDVAGLLRGIVRIWNSDDPSPLNGFGLQKLILWGTVCLTALIVIWAIWFVFRFASRRLPLKTATSRWIGIIAPSAFLLALAYVAYYVVPDLFDANMRVARAYNPDAAFVMTSLAAVCLAFGILRFLSLVAFPQRSKKRFGGHDA